MTGLTPVVANMEDLNEFMAALLDSSSHFPLSGMPGNMELAPRFEQRRIDLPFTGPSRHSTQLFKSASAIISPLLSAHCLASPLTLQTLDEL